MGVLSLDVERLVSTFLADLDTPVSLGVKLRLDARDWDGIAQLSVDPRAYHCAERYLRDNAAVSILKKYADFPTPSGDRRAKALAKWKDGERSCYHTNDRICRYLPEFRNSGDINAAVAQHFASIRKIIRSLIGVTPPSLVEGRFGPGATFSDRGRQATLPHKMSSNPTLTRNAIWYLPQWLGTQWGADFCARSGEFQFVAGNRYSTVPKTALTDRSIASEPSINVFYQLGLGQALRKRLRRPQHDPLKPDDAASIGWDLDTAQETHRRLARESSVHRRFATLDLSNASDTVAYNLVKLLLPHRWFEALESLRSPKTLVDGRWILLEKFSSMGNGFTFELETVIFAALAIHATRCAGLSGILGKDVFVFGDDIILPDSAVSEIQPLLTFCGFEVNSAKSYFGEVPFRESCGGDYFNGNSVRGYYLKEELNEPQKIISYLNGVKAISSRLSGLGASMRMGSWIRALDLLPSAVRAARGPEALGDVVIHDDEVRWRTKERHGIRYLRALVPGRRITVPFKDFRPGVVLACATYGSGNNGTPEKGVSDRTEGITPRDGLLGYKVGWVPYS